MMIDHLGKTFYCDKRMYEDMRIYCRDVVNSNMDNCMVVFGHEGSGKSLLARQISYVISHILFNEHNIVFNPTTSNIHFDLETYMKNILLGDKFQVNILDESRSLLNRKSSTTKESKKFTNFMSETRKFNCFHILLLPAFHDLDRNIFLWRTKYFVEVKTGRDDDDNLTRGTYRVHEKKKLLWYYENNTYELPKFNPKAIGFMGSFKGVEVFDDMDKYEQNQRDIMKDKYLSKPKVDEKHIIAKRMLDKGKSVSEVASDLDVSRQTIYNWGLK